MEKQYSTTNAQSASIDVGLKNYFIKVYNYMTGGLIITGIMAYLIMNSSLLGLFMQPTGGLSGLGWLVTLAPLFMALGLGWILHRGTLAQAQMLFWGFSAVMGCSLATIVVGYTGASITRVFLITSAMFGTMSLYGYTTKKDLTSIGSFLRMGLWGVIIASIVNIFMQSSALYYALSYITVAVFVGLTAYDTQKIKSMYYQSSGSEFLEKAAISGALSLYLDFINMFIALLRIFGDRR